MTSAGSVHETDSQSRGSGTTQRDGVGREVGGGFRMRGHVHPWVIHVNEWQNHHNIVISLQLN